MLTQDTEMADRWRALSRAEKKVVFKRAMRGEVGGPGAARLRWRSGQQLRNAYLMIGTAVLILTVTILVAFRRETRPSALGVVWVLLGLVWAVRVAPAPSREVAHDEDAHSLA